jgi:serine protease Do
MKKYLLILLFTVLILIERSSFAADKPWIEESNPEKVFPEVQLPSFAPVIEKLGQAVVNIRTEGKNEAEKQLDPNNPFDFFLQPQQPHSQRKFSSLGSGFLIHPDGYVVTNHHVVEGATKIFVTFKDEKSPLTAKVIGSDIKTDLALLKIEKSEKFVAAPLGNSDEVRAGDWVIAIGNPFRLGHTATVGIVSAVSRKLPGGKPYDAFIQTDASINPGNSGGPLFNSNGEVIGVNTAIYSRGGLLGGGSIGIGFAIPVNLVKTIVTQLKDKGKVTRGWLGVLIQPVDDDIAAAMKLESAAGALVADVIQGSPADKAGIKRGDVITKYDGQAILENSELPLLVAQTPLGNKVDLDVVRAGSSKTFKVLIEELKDEKISEEIIDAPIEDKFGLTTQDITPEISRSLRLNSTEGVIVSDVQVDSIAAEAGIRKGDVIIEVNSKQVMSAADFKLKTSTVKANVPLLLLIKRAEGTIFLTLKSTD